MELELPQVPEVHSSMAILRRIWSVLWGIARKGTWVLIGLWFALAVYFTTPVPHWIATSLAILVALLFIVSLRESVQPWQWLQRPFREKRFSTLAGLLFIGYAIHYFGFVTPDPNQNWAIEQSRTPSVRIEGNKVHVGNVRNFTWRSATDFTPGWYEQVYDLDAISSMYYVVAPFPFFEEAAHVFVSFKFSDGKDVAVSVEGRRLQGVPYRLIASMFRQNQLIYVVGDERDVVGLRGAIWKTPVFFYPARTTKERKQAIFVDMMKRAQHLEEHPEFYHLITNNCMNNILYHMRRLGGRPIPHDLAVLLTGISDRVAFDLGYIDTDLSFEQARQAFRVDPWMQTTTLDEGFAGRLRETLARQVAEVQNQPSSSSRSSGTAP